jgi:amino acid transporter
MVEPRKNVPRAIYLSILIVSFVYVSVALVALGNLGVERLIQAQEYALAEASKQFLGDFGFVLVAIGALFSTSSAINATLYGGANISYSLAKKGELPEIFERKIWFQATEGLYITAVLSLLFALFFNLGGIANLISAVFLVIYIFVIYSHFKLVDKVGGNKGFILFNLIIIISVFITLMNYQFKSNLDSFYTSLLIIFGSLIFEAFYRKITKREIKQRDLY